MSVPGEVRRFSPLNAPQRAAVDAFCQRTRPWALRQAARTYRHLPEDLREQAVDQAMRELRTGAPVGVDRRTLHRELADGLTEALRQLHVGWCLNQGAATWERDAASDGALTAVRARVAGFIEDGLGGLERAVLQLEIGAGRDSHTARAALRLNPRQYARHREQGLSKLRDAIVGQVSGQVCDHHVRDVVLAATGDRAAADGLASGPDRCRSCARQAQGLRGVLHERLALAPWPLAIKPAGLLAAKLGAAGAALGSKGAAGVVLGGSPASLSAGAAALAAVVAGAVIAAGGAQTASGGATADRAGDRRAAAAAVRQAQAADAPAPRTTSRAARRSARTPAAPRTGEPARRQRAPRRAAGTDRPTAAPTRAPAARPPAAPAAGLPAPAPDRVGDAVRDVTRPVRDTVEDVVAPVSPGVAAPVGEAVHRVPGGVDEVPGAVDRAGAGLLSP